MPAVPPPRAVGGGVGPAAVWELPVQPAAGDSGGAFVERYGALTPVPNHDGEGERTRLQREMKWRILKA